MHEELTSLKAQTIEHFWEKLHCLCDIDAVWDSVKAHAVH